MMARSRPGMSLPGPAAMSALSLGGGLSARAVDVIDFVLVATAQAFGHHGEGVALGIGFRDQVTQRAALGAFAGGDAFARGDALGQVGDVWERIL